MHRIARIGSADVVIIAGECLLGDATSLLTMVIDGTGVIVTTFPVQRLMGALARLNAAIRGARIGIVAVQLLAAHTSTIQAMIV